MNLGEDDDIFVLYTNTVNFLALPYKYEMRPDGDPDIEFDVRVQLANRKIKMPLLWSNREFIQNFQEILGDKDPQFRDAMVAIKNTNSNAVVNEVYDSIVEYSHYEEGLSALEIKGLPNAD